MFCVVVKTTGHIRETMVFGPYESREEARKGQRLAVSSLMNLGFNREDIGTEVKEMVKM